MAAPCFCFRCGAMNARNTKSWPLFAAGALFLLSGFASQSGVEAQAKAVSMPAALAQEAPKELSRFSLASALSGMRSVGADWAYIDALQYVGDHANLLDGRYKRTYPLYREILWLDPYFHFAVL